jgi:hypothetical protein
MVRFRLLSLCVLLAPVLGCTTEPCLSQKALTALLDKCQIIGEMTGTMATLRDMNLPREEAITRQRILYPLLIEELRQTEQQMAEAVYTLPAWTPEQLHNKATLLCLTRNLGK